MLRSTMLLRSGLCRHSSLTGVLPGNAKAASLLRPHRNPTRWRDSLRWMNSGSDSFGESIPEELIEEGDETEGEWMGCTRKFLAPISVNSRGAGEF